MRKLISINGLSFSYGRKKALHNTSFDLERGGITALIGHNGAGKTTLMRAISGLLPIPSEKIFVDDIDVAQHPRQVHRMVSFLSDTLGFYPALSVADNLSYAAEINGVSGTAAQKAVEDTLHRLDLSSKRDELTGNLSRGWRQRVAIGQAIVHAPSFLALDEPATGLDPDARLALSKLFEALRQDGMTLLVSSHILAELEDYCDNIVMLEDGKLVGQRDLQHFLKTGNGDPRRLEIELIDDLASTERALLILSQNTQCSDITQSSNTINVRYNGNENEQHMLLKNLFAADVKVRSVAEINVPSRESLRDAYTRMTNKTDQE